MLARVEEMSGLGIPPIRTIEDGAVISDLSQGDGGGAKCEEEEPDGNTEAER
jgi:hypothetical protein